MFTLSQAVSYESNYCSKSSTVFSPVRVSFNAASFGLPHFVRYMSSRPVRKGVRLEIMMRGTYLMIHQLTLYVITVNFIWK
jgi:hypothetical protein